MEAAWRKEDQYRPAALIVIFGKRRVRRCWRAIAQGLLLKFSHDIRESLPGRQMFNNVLIMSRTNQTHLRNVL